MSKGIKKLFIFILLLCMVLIQVAFVSGKENNDNTTVSNATVNAICPQNCSPDIKLQTSYISDALEAGKTYEYNVQIRNVDFNDITIEPRFNANYPIIYNMIATEQASGVSTTSIAQVSNNIPATSNIPMSNDAPAVSGAISVISTGTSGQSSGVATEDVILKSNSTPATNATPTTNNVPSISSAMPLMSTGTNGQAFDNSAVNISAPSTIKAGEVVNMTITIVVPDDSTGNYYSSIDMNVNGVENNQYNPQLSLSFTIQQPLTVPYVKTFSTTTNALVMIDVSADTYNSDMGTRISPKIEDPSFDPGLTCNGSPVSLTLVKTVESENVFSGIIYPTWLSTTENSYQSYGKHYVEIYKARGAVGDYKFSILPKNTNNFVYSITIGNNT